MAEEESWTFRWLFCDKCHFVSGSSVNNSNLTENVTDSTGHVGQTQQTALQSGANNTDPALIVLQQSQRSKDSIDQRCYVSMSCLCGF